LTYFWSTPVTNFYSNVSLSDYHFEVPARTSKPGCWYVFGRALSGILRAFLHLRDRHPALIYGLSRAGLENIIAQSQGFGHSRLHTLRRLQDKARVRDLTLGLDERLTDVLPSYMVPSAYIPIGSMQMTVMGKTDRRRLREMGEALTVVELAALHHRDGPRGRQLQGWRGSSSSSGHTYSKSTPTVSARTTSSYELAATRLVAMWLVGAARGQGIAADLASYDANL
jgi:hypothetical protein